MRTLSLPGDPTKGLNMNDLTDRTRPVVDRILDALTREGACTLTGLAKLVDVDYRALPGVIADLIRLGYVVVRYDRHGRLFDTSVAYDRMRATGDAR